MDVKTETISSMSVLETITKTEIDTAVSTAKTYPRDLEKAKKELMALATVNQETAELCAYSLTRKQRNKKTGQMENVIIQGASVRLAELLVYCYGNTRNGVRIVGNDGRRVKAMGICHDLEKNNFNALEVERSILTTDGRTFSQDMQIITANAAGKIAWRNAVFATIPGAVWNEVYQKCLALSKGTQDTLAPRRENAMKWFAGKGVTPEQIFDVLAIKTLEEIDLEKLQILSGMKSSIVLGEFNVEELFPKPDPGLAGKKEKGDEINDKTKEMIDQNLKGKGKKRNGKQGDLPLES